MDVNGGEKKLVDVAPLTDIFAGRWLREILPAPPQMGFFQTVRLGKLCTNLLLGTSATLVVTSALLVVTMFAIRNKCLTTRNKCLTVRLGSLRTSSSCHFCLEPWSDQPARRRIPLTVKAARGAFGDGRVLFGLRGLFMPFSLFWHSRCLSF